MRFRFRIGPFTFGRSGTRLSLWSGGTGVSVPLSKKKRGTFGKVKIGPVSAYFGGSSSKPTKKQTNQTKAIIEEQNFTQEEAAAIKAFSSDRRSTTNSKTMACHGVESRNDLSRRFQRTFPIVTTSHTNLCRKAMDAVFGQQNIAWKTEKRPSKSGKGFTTWIVAVKKGV